MKIDLILERSIRFNQNFARFVSLNKQFFYPKEIGLDKLYLILDTTYSFEEKDMATAFILINTDVAAEEEVMEKLKELPEVETVHLVYGIYDLIVKVRADNLDDLKKGVTGNLRGIEKIRSTMTMIAVE